MVSAQHLCRSLAVLGLLTALAACSKNTPPPLPTTTSTASQAAATAGDVPGALPADASADISSYRLGGGDQLRVVIFQQEDLSGEYELDGRGRFAMPLVGELNADGLTVRELERRIAEAYSGDFLVDPQVNAEVLNYRPFFILGEVQDPGSYPFVNGTTVLNAIALAGGESYRADLDDVRIKRGGENQPEYSVSLTTEVLPGDIIRVTERLF